MALLFHPGGGPDPDLLRHRHPARSTSWPGPPSPSWSRPDPSRRPGRGGRCTSAGPARRGRCSPCSGSPRARPRACPATGCSRAGSCSCAVLAAVVVADARLLGPGGLRPGALGPAAALHRHHLLRDLPVALADLRVPHRRPDRPSTGPLDAARVAVTLAGRHGQLLPGRAADPPGQAPRARCGCGWPRWPGVATAVAMVVATIPAVADPDARWPAPRTWPPRLGAGAAGGRIRRLHARQVADPPPARAPISPGRPVAGHDHRRLGHARRLLRHHGRPVGHRRGRRVPPTPSTGSGSTTATNWPTSIPSLIRTSARSSSSPPGAGTSTGRPRPTRCTSRRSTRRCCERAVRVMLTPGDGVDGVDLHPVPAIGEIPAANPADQGVLQHGAPGQGHRRPGTPSPRRCRRCFPGRVMYLPLADSILLDGHFSGWLPPEGDPHAPSDQWLRVRKLDNVHLCPEGSARYADALLTDLTACSGWPRPRPTGPRGRGRPTRTSTIRPGRAPTITLRASGLRAAAADDGALRGRRRL